ncbi:unnamed protein product, partial [Urochloa humidicola]
DDEQISSLRGAGAGRDTPELQASVRELSEAGLQESGEGGSAQEHRDDRRARGRRSDAGSAAEGRWRVELPRL